MKLNFLILISAGLFFQQSIAQEQPQVFRGAKLYLISGEPIENGVLVIQNGKIVAVGLADNIQVPADATEHDVTGKVIMPGLVESPQD